MKPYAFILISWMLTVLSVKAQNSFPSKQLINGETVICSTVEQQKIYLQWKAKLDECTEISAEKDKTIFLMDSLVREQKKLVALQDHQDANYRVLVSKLTEINTLVNEKYDIMQNAFKQERKKNRKTKFAIGFSVGTVALLTTSLLIFKLVK